MYWEFSAISNNAKLSANWRHSFKMCLGFHASKYRPRFAMKWIGGRAKDGKLRSETAIHNSPFNHPRYKKNGNKFSFLIDLLLAHRYLVHVSSAHCRQSSTQINWKMSVYHFYITVCHLTATFRIEHIDVCTLLLNTSGDITSGIRLRCFFIHFSAQDWCLKSFIIKEHWSLYVQLETFEMFKADIRVLFDWITAFSPTNNRLPNW